MDLQEFEELWITLNELYSANRYLEYIELSSPAIESANALALYDKAMHLLRYSCMSYYQVGDLQISINLLEKYRELTFLYGNDIDVIQYYSLASIYWGTFGQQKKSEELLMKGLEIAERIQHIESMGKIYNNLSGLEIELGKYAKAKRLALKSLFYTNEFDLKHDPPYKGIIHAKTNLAIAHIWLEEFEEANTLLQELLMTIKDPPYNKAQLEVFNAQALLYEKQGRIGEAIDMYQKAKHYALQNNDLSLLQTIYNSLVKLIEEQGNKIILSAVQKEYINILLEIQRENYTQVLFEMEYNDQKKHFERTSYIDPLTNIYNRRYFDEQAKEMVKSAASNQKLLALLMIDLDHFKSINDSNGHLFGDDALSITATTLQQFFQPYEAIVARFGGDEFIVLLHLREGESISIIAQNLYHSLTSLALTVNETVVQLEFSIGVSTNEHGYITQLEQLIHNADSALYASKRNGRNQITLYNQYNDAGNSK
ncbi:GGDEF domain-containing protein [Lysinibacillus mangiferihumi]|uniref:GGDEF domain-containing protein n=1 Tax=Lysinibacillus mangiferihumi TaxID=1130819 RepID=A0A4U2Y0B4_9BACI|nr:tetratricopeptide repeat-containing diguanylate cyclase [Lysinibacillus mangiferihumi]TKI53760.1 GGDEF domain-containing protein [Lysinibacillus mangiferihumi]